jgi:hypothetical protein
MSCSAYDDETGMYGKYVVYTKYVVMFKNRSQSHYDFKPMQPRSRMS